MSMMKDQFLTPQVAESALDWSKAGVYRKASVLSTAQIRECMAATEHVVTRNSAGAVEREGDAKPGDKIVTDGRGQPYIITREKFASLYEADPATPGQLRSKNSGQAFQTSAPVAITRGDGTVVQAGAGDYIFRSDVTGTLNVIAGDEFQRTFRPERGTGGAAPIPNGP